MIYGKRREVLAMKELKIPFDTERKYDINLFYNRTSSLKEFDQTALDLTTEVLCGAEIGFSEGDNVLVSIEKKENYISIKIDDSQLEE